MSPPPPDPQATEPPTENAVEVPIDALAPETLRNLAEEFVTRDGTDYGAHERSLDEKVEGLMHQLERGEAKIFYEAKSETINIVARQSLRSARGDD
jgi:uncharacterized protein YheU (UPF0270 family)